MALAISSSARLGRSRVGNLRQLSVVVFEGTARAIVIVIQRCECIDR